MSVNAGTDTARAPAAARAHCCSQCRRPSRLSAGHLLQHAAADHAHQCVASPTRPEADLHLRGPLNPGPTLAQHRPNPGITRRWSALDAFASRHSDCRGCWGARSRLERGLRAKEAESERFCRQSGWSTSCCALLWPRPRCSTCMRLDTKASGTCGRSFAIACWRVPSPFAHAGAPARSHAQ